MNPKNNQFPDKFGKKKKNKKPDHFEEYDNKGKHPYDKGPDDPNPPRAGGAGVPRKPIKPKDGGGMIRTVSIDPADSLINPPSPFQTERQV